jgi:transposase InsO family protein
MGEKSGRSIAVPARPSPNLATRSIRICCAEQRSRGRTVWAMDITYIPIARGFVYLTVALDWFSRRVPSWRVSITMEAAFCVETLEEALAKHGRPEISNTDQGSQFTGAAFTGLLIKNGIAISMDGYGAWRDNVFVERLWRSVNTRRCISGPTTAWPRPAHQTLHLSMRKNCSDNQLRNSAGS